MGLHQRKHRLSFEPSAVTPRAEPLALTELLDEFLGGYRYTGSPRTLKHYEMYLGRQFVPWLAAHNITRLDQLQTRHIERYLGELVTERKLAPVSVRKIYGQINRFCSWCYSERRYSNSNPCAVVKAPKVPEGTREGFSDDEMRRLTKVTDKRSGFTGSRDRAILALLLDTGMRASELVNLRVADIDWPRHRILIHLGKGARDRWCPLGAETQRRLKVWLRVRAQQPSDLLWLSQRRGKFKYDTLRANLRLLGEYADVPDCTPHRFRHSFATAYYRAHHDLIALQTLLGHASIEMTMRYLRMLGVSYGAESGYRTPGEWLLQSD